MTREDAALELLALTREPAPRAMVALTASDEQAQRQALRHELADAFGGSSMSPAVRRWLGEVTRLGGTPMVVDLSPAAVRVARAKLAERTGAC